jgi:hypothetical protein
MVFSFFLVAAEVSNTSPAHNAAMTTTSGL